MPGAVLAAPSTGAILAGLACNRPAVQDASGRLVGPIMPAQLEVLLIALRRAASDAAMQGPGDAAAHQVCGLGVAQLPVLMPY